MKENISIRNQSGLELSCLLDIPEGEHKFPLVILLAGYGTKKEDFFTSELSTFLVDTGIASIRIDFSGIGDSQGEFKTDYKLTKMMVDLALVYKYIQTLSNVDMEKIGIFGQSMGGLLAINLASKHSIHAMCIVSTPSNIAGEENFKEQLEKGEQGGFIEFNNNGNRVVRVPHSFIVDAIEFDVLEVVERVKCPVSFIVGDNDVTVTPENTKKIYEHANEPKQLVTITDMPHFYNYVPDVLEKVNKEALKFFLTHFK